MTMQRFKGTNHRLTRLALAAFAVLGLVAGGASAAQSKPKPTTKPSAAKVDIMLMQPAATAVKSGDNQFEVMVEGADGKPIENADVSVLFVMPPMGAMAEMRNEVKLKPAGGGKYTGSGNVMMAGKWNVTISVKQNGKEIGQKKIAVTAK
jgi:YtkA-like